jgi:hypothetical protein
MPFSGHRYERMHVVSAPVGSGKTSFSVGFVAALVRLSERDINYPFGAVIVVNQIDKADATFRELDALIPGKVAIYTSDHDPNSTVPEGERRVRNPVPGCTREELREKPVAIVTHKFYNDKNGHLARRVMHNGELKPRAITVIDEQIEDIEVFDVALWEAEKVKDQVWGGDAEVSQGVGAHTG